MDKIQKVLADFEKATGKTAEEGIKRMAKSSCKRLATTVHPYGLKGGGKMDKFVKHLALQVTTAWFGVNVGAYPQTNSISEAHRQARRGRTMRVPARRFRKEQGKPWLNLIPRKELDAHIKIIQEKAFRAKAAWVRIGNDLGKPKMSGVSRLVERHVSSALGTHAVSGHGLSASASIQNRVPYISKIQTEQDVARSQIEGMKNGLKYMQKVTEKEIEKVNRATS